MVMGQRPTCYPTVSCIHRPRLAPGMYLYVRIDAWIFWQKKRKQNPLTGDDASTGEAAPGGLERDEKCEARRPSTTPNGGPQGVYGSKPGLNLTCRLLRRHGQHICTYIFTYGEQLITKQLLLAFGRITNNVAAFMIHQSVTCKTVNTACSLASLSPVVDSLINCRVINMNSYIRMHSYWLAR